MSNDVELPVRQAAVIYLKNMVLENHKNHCNQNIKITKIIAIKTFAIKTIIINHHRHLHEKPNSHHQIGGESFQFLRGFQFTKVLEWLASLPDLGVFA